MTNKIISNIFSLAMSVLPRQTATLFRWQGRATNDRGLDVDDFGPGEPLTGCSIQPVNRSRYGYFGLDASKSYMTVYSTEKVNDLTRSGNPDQIEYQGRRYRVMNRSEWHAPADYNGMLVIDIGPALLPPSEEDPHAHNRKRHLAHPPAHHPSGSGGISGPCDQTRLPTHNPERR